MNRFYKPISTITFEHSFYSNRVCPDFDVTPTGETAARMRGHRMMWGTKNRKAPDKYELVAESVGATLLAATPLIPLPATTSFCFGVALKNTNFVNFTVLDPRAANQVYLIRNVGILTDLTIQVIDLVGSLWQWDGLSNSTVNIVSPEGTANFSVVPIENGGTYSALINFSGRPEGVYSITSGLVTKSVFVSQELVGKGLFGVLYLQEDSNDHIQLAHKKAFLPREALWKYFVVLRGNHTGRDYYIRHTPTIGSAIVFGSYPEASWTADDLGTHLKQKFVPPETVIGFISASAVKFSDVARSSIELKRGLPVEAPTYGTQFPIVVNNLPNPSPGSAAAAMVVMVDPPL